MIAFAVEINQSMESAFFCACVIMATNFLELATTLTYLGANWLPAKKVNFTPWCSITALSPNILSIVYKYLVACLVVERHHEALINP